MKTWSSTGSFDILEKVGKPPKGTSQRFNSRCEAFPSYPPFAGKADVVPP